MRRNESPSGIVSSKLNVVVIEPSREMQRLLRGMLASYGIRNVKMFADSARAANAVLSDPPSLVVMEWEAGPHNGADFLKLFRHQNMYPVCLMPIVILLSEARQRSIERALKLGAHAVVAKPLSPQVLMRRINWVLSGNPMLKLAGDRYVVDGVRERLKEEKERQHQLDNARAFQESQFADMDDIQRDVDRLLQSNF